MESMSWGRTPQARVGSDWDWQGVKFHQISTFLFRKEERSTLTLFRSEKNTKLCEPLNFKSVSCAHVPINTKLHIFFSPINQNFKKYLLHAPESVWRWWTKQSVLLTSWSGHPTKFQTVFSFLSILSRTETFVLGLDKKQKTAENWNCPVFQKTNSMAHASNFHSDFRRLIVRRLYFAYLDLSYKESSILHGGPLHVMFLRMNIEGWKR